MRDKGAGFTLIELLVAISIIAVLSVIAITTYQGVQSKTRDSIRKQDLNKLAIALEIYYQQNHQYIGTPQPTDGSCSLSSNQFEREIAAKIDGPVPKDPQNNQPYLYTAENNCQSFRLFAKLENCQPSDSTLCIYTNYNYTVTSADLSPMPAPAQRRGGIRIF